MKLTASTISASRRLRFGFSLAELLVAVAVLGILTAIALPLVPKVTESATVVRDRHNAQNLASLAMAASVTGVSFADLDSAIAQLTQGSVRFEGAGLAEAMAHVSNLTASEIQAAKHYLSFQGGVIVYSAS